MFYIVLFGVVENRKDGQNLYKCDDIYDRRFYLETNTVLNNKYLQIVLYIMKNIS